MSAKSTKIYSRLQPKLASVADKVSPQISAKCQMLSNIIPVNQSAFFK